MITHELFNIFCWIWIGVAIIVFPVLLKVTQPYGKHLKGNWGPLINNRPGWFLMELPALAVFGFFLAFKADSFSTLVLIATSLWGLHYIHRVFIYPFQIRTAGKKMPLIIVICAISFNTVNGFLNGYWLGHFSSGYRSGILSDSLVTTGLILFLTGFVINKYHDWKLIKLRSIPGSKYKIPFGGLFRYVSCPNFLGEIISWAGFFLVAFNLPALSFLIWTIVNLTPRALDHHKWYKSEFSDYPEDRKAIIPYLL